jgi:hypothetical protein
MSWSIEMTNATSATIKAVVLRMSPLLLELDESPEAPADGGLDMTVTKGIK